MHFSIRETLSFNLMYVAACYPVGTTISKTSSLFTALLHHYILYQSIYLLSRLSERLNRDHLTVLRLLSTNVSFLLV